MIGNVQLEADLTDSLQIHNTNHHMYQTKIKKNNKVKLTYSGIAHKHHSRTYQTLNRNPKREPHDLAFDTPFKNDVHMLSMTERAKMPLLPCHNWAN